MQISAIKGIFISLHAIFEQSILWVGLGKECQFAVEVSLNKHCLLVDIF